MMPWDVVVVFSMKIRDSLLLSFGLIGPNIPGNAIFGRPSVLDEVP